MASHSRYRAGARSAEWMLREFHELIPPAAPAVPTATISDEVRELRKRLILDEVEELLAAIDAGDLAGIAKEGPDAVYTIIGTVVAFGLPWDRLFAAVHAENMTKDPGADGKAVKGPRFQPADITGIIEEAIARA